MKLAKGGTSSGAKQIVAKYGIYLVFILIFVAMSLARKAFCSPDNIVNILKQASIVSVIAIGQTFCLITGGMDLSASSVMALTGVCSAMYGLEEGTNMFMAVLMGLGVGMICGLVNGVIIAKFRVPAFITTLGMQQAARGMALLITNARPVFGLSKTYTFLGNGNLLGIPMLVIVMLVVVLAAWIVLEHTRFGRHVYAVGGNEMSAHVSGINVERVQIIVYVIMGALSGLGGFLLSGRLQSGSPTMAEGYELDAIAGAVIGGVSTSGGVGKVYGAVIGSLLLSMISNGLNMLDVSAYYQQIIKGAIIVLAVLIDVRTKGTKK